MQAIIAPCPAGLRGFDTASRVTAAQARAMRAADFRYAIRYVSLGATNKDTTGQECDGILDAGLGLALVQRVRWGGEWRPTGKLGAQDGANAARHASALGYPAGGLLWCDLEGVAGYSPDRRGKIRPRSLPQDIVAHLNAWAAAVVAAGYRAGLYVGAGAGLDGATLGALPLFHAYWDSCSRNPAPTPRGWQLIQSGQRWVDLGPAGKLCIDPDTTHEDARGALPLFAWRAEALEK